MARPFAWATLLTGLAALPLLAQPALFDFPNHLARVHVLARLDTVPGFAAWFRWDTFLLPNVLADLVLLGLEPFGGVEPAGRLLLLGVTALTLFGVVAVNTAAVGRPSPWPLLAAALLWHEILFWGFLNYALGLGLLLWALAGWLWFEERSRTLQLLTAAGFGLIVLLAHLVAFGLFAVAVATLELARCWHRREDGAMAAARRLTVSALAFVPALGLFLGASPTSGLPFDPRFAFTAWQKLSAFSRLLSSGNTALDIATLCAVLALAVGAVAAGQARLHPGLTLVAAVFALLSLVLPYAAFGSYFLDGRIPIAAALVLTAALVPGHRSDRPSATTWGRAWTGLLAVVVAVRSLVLLQDWREQELHRAPVLQAFARLPPGALLVPADAAPFELGDWTTTRRIRPAHEHTAGYAAIRADAAVANIFAREGQNPLVFAPPDPALRGLARNPIHRAGTAMELESFLAEVESASWRLQRSGRRDVAVFAVIFHRGCGSVGRRPTLRPVACGSDFALLQVLPAEGPAEPPGRDAATGTSERG